MPPPPRVVYARAVQAGAPDPDALPRARDLFARALRKPTFDEPLGAVRQRPYWLTVQIIGVVALLIDIGFLIGLRGDGRVDRTTLDAFAMINVPLLILLLAMARSRSPRMRTRTALVVSILATHVTVIVWVQVTGSLSSYFIGAGAMLLIAQRAMLSWRAGVFCVAVLVTLHAGAFLAEEVGVLAQAPLFRAAPGPIYESVALRWAIFVSITNFYVLSWMCGNILTWALRNTERALATAERRLAAAAEGAREGRLTGRTIGAYRLLEVVGRGGMAEVYLGTRVGDPDDAPFAIKVVHPHLVDDELRVARVRREAELASSLPASVTPAVRDVQLAGPGERFVVLDHLPGEDLAALLRRRQRLPLDEAIPLIVAACRALAAVHARGIVHRDVKPHNLFVLPDGTVRILDFGVARREDHDDETLTRFGAILGTPGYIAPEMVAIGTAVGPAADVFALGVVAYQVLTGVRPFAATVLGSSAAAPAPVGRLIASVPADVDAVIALALAQSPDRRYVSASELADDLQHAAAGTLSAAARGRAHREQLSVEETLASSGE